jgi:chromosome segregation ATPase
LSRELREGEGKVQMLQSSRANTLLAYGEWMPGIVKAVNAAQSRFRKPPKGPIGVMFKLHDYRWSTAIEAILGKNLSAFVVDNTYDKKTLEAVMKREIRGQRMIPDIIVSRYTGRPYDVSRKKPQTHHPTVLDMMEVGDLEVRNALIDQCHVDTDLLIEKRLEAERVIEVERPRGANVAYTIEGDQILTGRFYANKKRPRGIIKESVDRAIEEEQRRLRDLETQQYNLDNRLMELQKESAMSKRLMCEAKAVGNPG